MSNELRARCAAMLSEKWDFIGAPFTQMLDFQQSFYGNLATAMAPLAPYSSEARLLDAEARCMARETLKTESLVAPVTAAQAGQQRAMNVPQLMGPGGAPPPGPRPPSMPQQYALPPPGGVPGPGPPPGPRPPGMPMPGGPMAPPGPRPPPVPAAAPPPGAPAGGQQLRALTAYEPADPRMIPMNAGEIMIKEKEEGGWFFGSNSRGQQGFFPGSYCEPV